MKLIGIDPGLDGAYALLEQVNNEPVKLLEAHIIPTFIPNNKVEIDITLLRMHLREHYEKEFKHCYVELQTIYGAKKRTVQSEKKKLENYWLLLQIIDNIGIEKTEVTWQQWQAFRNRMTPKCLDSKEKSRIVCLKLYGEKHCFEHLKMKQAQKLHDGKCDAALIGVYGLHHITRNIENA